MIKRSGKPIAVIMSVSDYEDMENLLDALMEEADQDFQKALLASREEYEAGEVGSENDLWDALKQKPMPQQYRLIPTKTFLKNLEKPDKQTKKRVSQALQEIKDNPYRGEKLTNKKFGKWRFIVGDYQHRKDIYKEE
jgi:hypothetical protein